MIFFEDSKFWGWGQFRTNSVIDIWSIFSNKDSNDSRYIWKVFEQGFIELQYIVCLLQQKMCRPANKNEAKSAFFAHSFDRSYRKS